MSPTYYNLAKYLLVGTLVLQLVAPAYQMANMYPGPAVQPTVRPESTAELYADDPENAATSESAYDDTMCFNCNDRVRLAQANVAVHLKLMDKQSKLIRQITAAAAAAGSSTPNSPQQQSSNRRPKSTQQQIATRENSTTSSSGQASDSARHVVVSRLRVARSADEMPHGTEAGNSQPSLARPRKGYKNNADPALKQLKHKQVQQLNETCKSLFEVQQCLHNISRECLGNLHFHSLEVFCRQWITRLYCSKDPTFKPFGELTRSIPRIDDRERTPMVRPISSQEETQKKLNAIFPGRNMAPLGVMLKPTLTRSASQKFNSISQHQQHYDEPAGSFGSTKGRHLLSANGMFDPVQSENQLVPSVSQLVLIPCCLVMIIALVTVMSRLIRKPIKT